MDTWPNQEALNKALNIYRAAMRPFIISCLKQIRGMDVESAVIDSLGYRRANEIERLLIQSDRNIESAIDINDFPYIVNKNWDSAFDTLLNNDKAFRNQLWLIVECRNADWAHPPDGDAEFESTRAHLFLIADVLGKIKKTEAKDGVEAIRDRLFHHTEERLTEAEERLVALETENSEYKKSLEAAQAEGNDYKERFETTEQELNAAKNQLKKVKAENTKYKKSLEAAEKGLETAQTERNDYKERFKTTEQELENTKAECQICEDNLKATSDRLEDAVGAWVTSMEGLTALRKLFTIAKIGNQTVQDIYPSIETDSTVRILDCRGVADKRNFLLDLLEQKQPTVIYVQSEEMADLLLERVIPEKADAIEKHSKQTSEAEEREILERLENREKIAVVSNTTFSTLASSHCVEHFVFCHLVPGLDEFFRQCEPVFASEKHAYLHLIYNSEQDIEGLAQKYLDREALEKLYLELRQLAGTDSNFIKTGSLHSTLDMAKLGIETGLAIFQELQLLECNDEGIKFLPSSGKKLDASEIYRRGEQLKNGAADFQVFQFEQSIEQIWEALLKELNVDNEQILEASNVYEVSVFQDAIENSKAQSELSTDAVEDDNTVDNEDPEAKPTSTNAKVPVEDVTEIRSRSTTGESNSELAEEDSEKEPEVKQSEFWQPIRDGEFGALFAGKPVPVRDDGWISKRIRGVELILSFRKNRSYVSFLCSGENRIERRDEIITLFPEADYDYSPHESPQRAGFRFPVINKGKDHPEDWDEIRKKLVAMGTDIYNKIDESDL